MDIELLILKLSKDLISRRDIPKLRGFIAGKYSQNIEFHNHTKDGGFKYGYPMIQYKVLDSIPILIAINEACQLLVKLSFELKEININERMIEINEKEFMVKKEQFGISQVLLQYCFLTPWMALNQDNYKLFLNYNCTEKKELLNKILIGNILSISKSLSYSIDEKIIVDSSLVPCKINFKNQAMIAFKGEFRTNFYIPDCLGIGKAVSRGFGAVKKLEKEF